MQHKNVIAITLVAALAAVPMAGAWSVDGGWEPDTQRDLDDDYMWTEPDTSESGERVYFNVVQNTFTGLPFNPNTAITKSAIRNAPIQSFHAYLGIWKDCNADGYIGLADGAIGEYRSELLLDSTICPAGSTAHNDGQWVYEFRWIGPNDLSNETTFGHIRGINDTSARVWSDFGLPGEAPGGSCPINPQPAGMTASTGGLIDYFDCIANQRITTTINDADAAAGGAGLYMDPDSPQTSDSLLNQRFPAHLWYDPYGETNDEKTGLLEEYESHRGDESHSKNSAFSTWDCSNPRGTAEVTDPTGQLGAVEDPTGLLFDEPIAFTDEDGVIVAIPSANPSLNNPTGSYQDALNDTESGITFGGYPFASSENPHRGCEGDETFLQGETTNEASFGGTNTNVGKMRTDTHFAFDSGSFLAAPDSFDNNVDACVLNDVPPGCADTIIVPDGTIPDDTPYEGGIAYYRSWQGPVWRGLINWVRDPQVVNRGDLQPSGASYMTTYAYVNSALFAPGSLPPAGTGVYGAEWCDGATTGIVDGFDCDKTHWWNPKYDASNTAMPTQTANTDETCYDPETQEFDGRAGCRDLGAVPGQEYQLRDIDCYDGMVVYGLVYASLAQIATTGVCTRPTGSPVPDVPAPSVG